MQKGTAATLDFAAVLVQSSRVLRSFNRQFSGLADSCLTAATKAWQWAQKNPAIHYDQDAINKIFEPKISTGGYGDRTFDDELFWAACELFATAKDQQYFAAIQNDITANMQLPSWNNLHMTGLYTLLRCKNGLPAEEQTVIAAAKNHFLIFADSLAGGMANNAFKTVMGKNQE